MRVEMVLPERPATLIPACELLADDSTALRDATHDREVKQLCLWQSSGARRQG